MRSGRSRNGAPRRAALALVAAAALGLTGCPAASHDAAPAAADAPPVRVRTDLVGTGTAPRRLRVVGTLVPEEEMTVAAEVQGRVVAVLHDVGDRVPPGEPLVRIDDRDLVLERDQRRRALEETLTRLGLEELPADEPDLAGLPNVASARVAAANANARWERGRALFERDPPLISEQALADLRAAAEVARSDEEGALLAARTLLAEARTRRALLDVAEDRLRRTHVVTPDGARPALPGATTAGAASPPTYVVAERSVAVGDYVRVGDPLLRLVDADPLLLRLAVPERRMTGVVVGLAVQVSVASAGEPVAAKLVRVRPEVDPRTRTYVVEAAVPNAALALAPGAFATAEIELGTDETVVLVPESALRTFAGVHKVLVVADGRAVERPVTIGRRIGGRVEIVEGLDAGESYLPAPPASLVPGSRVTPEGAPEGG